MKTTLLPTGTGFIVRAAGWSLSQFRCNSRRNGTERLQNSGGYHGRISCNHQHRHRLAYGTSDAQDNARSDSRNRERYHHLIYSLPTGSANARLASRMARGQFRIASSLTVMIVGSAMIAKTILPANPVSPTGRLKTF